MSEKIKVHIKNALDVNEEVEIEISPDSTVRDFTKKVAKAFWAKQSEANYYYKGFGLVWNYNLVNYGDDMNKKINSLAKPITNGADIKISFFKDGSVPNNILSWDVLSKKEIETLEKKLSPSEKEGGDEKENEKKIVEQSGKESSWPWTRITLGVMDLLELSITIAGYALGFHIVILIILIVLFVLGTIGFFGWKPLFTECLQKKMNLGTGSERKSKDQQRNKEEKNEKPEEQKQGNQDKSQEKKSELGDH